MSAAAFYDMLFTLGAFAAGFFLARAMWKQDKTETTEEPEEPPTLTDYYVVHANSVGFERTVLENIADVRFSGNGKLIMFFDADDDAVMFVPLESLAYAVRKEPA